MEHSALEYEKFAAHIGVTFSDLGLLREAFTHRSSNKIDSKQ